MLPKYGQALHSATDALRPNQGREVSEQYRKDLKAVPVFKNIMSLDAFKGKVEAIQTQKAAEKARAEMVSQNLQPQRVKEEEKEPESQAALAGSAEPASKEDDEDEIVDLSPQQTQDGLQGPSAASMPKAKVKPTPKKDRGRARGRGGRTVAAHGSRGRGRAGSCASLAGDQASETSKTSDQSQRSAKSTLAKYKEDLNIESYLNGKRQLGQVYFQASRHLTAVKGKQGSSVEFALLAGHCEEFKKAYALMDERILKLSTETRREYIKDLHH